MTEAEAAGPDEASRRRVEALAGYGVSEADIARVLAMEPATLRRLYRAELDSGHIKTNSKVAENLFRKATGEGREAVIAAIFWLKTRAGWRETNVHEVSGPNGAPIELVEHSPSDLAAALLGLLNTARSSEGRQPGSLPSHLVEAGDPP
jgi:hypothetical protein